MICIYKIRGCRDGDDVCCGLLGLLSRFRSNTLLPSSRLGGLKHRILTNLNMCSNVKKRKVRLT